MATNDKTSTEIMKEKFEDKELNAEQLENVAGGTYEQIQLDSFFLNYLLGNDVCRRWDGKASGVYEEGEVTSMVKNAWAKVGVKADPWGGYQNDYYIDNKKVTRKQAFEHAQKVLGKQVKDSDWMPWR